MNAYRGRQSGKRGRRSGLTGHTGPADGSGLTRLVGRSRLAPVYVVLTAAMILLCRPITATAADGEGVSTSRVVTDKSAGIVKIPVGPTAASAIQRTQSVASRKQPSPRPTDPQGASSSAGRANTCPATNEGMLNSLGGSWSGDTTFSTDNFEASVLIGCGADTNPFGRDEIFQFTVDADGNWRFDTCTVAAGWDTSLSLREETGGGCPGDFVACDEDGCNVVYYESAVSAFLTAGPTYYLIVDGWSTFAYGEFTVTYEITGDISDGDCPGTDVGELSSAGGSWTGDTTGLADSFDASLLGCDDLTGGRDEIFQFTVDADGIWKFDTCTVAAEWDTSLSLREEVGGGCPGEFIACDGDGCGLYYESLQSAFLTAGPTYYLIVDGWSTFAYGDFTITYENLGPVPNGCPGRNEGVLSTAGGSWTSSTNNSTDDFDDRFINCTSNPGGRDEIFQFTVEAAGIWSFDTCTVPAGWDTNLTLRKETGGGCPGDFVACDDDECGGPYYESAFESFVEANTTYYLIVDGWSSFAYGDFTITYANVDAGCTEDAQCDDGVFCNGAEFCVTDSGLCFFGEPPCQTPGDCDEIKGTCSTDPCITWRAGRGGGSFFPQANNCPNTATWVFDEIQVTHLRGDVLDSYTTPLVSDPGVPGASPGGTPFPVDQAIWTVELDTCNPLAIVTGTQCSPSGTVGGGLEPFPCSGTMPVLPNNSGDFDRCEIDFFIAFRTAENGAGMLIAIEEESIGGPGAADEFGVNVIWIEDCPPTGIFGATTFGDDVNLPADFATAEVCQKPECGIAAVTDVFFADADSVARLGIDQPGNCAIDAREPHSISDATDRNGWDRMVMSFSCDPTSLGLSTGDFSVSTTPPNGLVAIGSVSADGVDDTVTVTLTDMISPGVWTCISHPASGGQWCMGYLPADASQDRLSSAGDITALINSINLVPGFLLPLHAGDMNRSGVVNGQDILRLIDLLNGAGEFVRWIAASLPACPSE